MQLFGINLILCQLVTVPIEVGRKLSFAYCLDYIKFLKTVIYLCNHTEDILCDYTGYYNMNISNYINLDQREHYKIDGSADEFVEE